MFANGVLRRIFGLKKAFSEFNMLLNTSKKLIAVKILSGLSSSVQIDTLQSSVSLTFKA
jgi:hypothetical protein